MSRSNQKRIKKQIICPMENLGWDGINSSTMPPTIWTNQYYVNFSDSGTKYSIIGSKMEFNEALLSSSLELHGDSIDLDRVNEMAEMLAPAFDSITDHASDPCHFLEHHQEAMRFAADSVLSSHQLASLPPTVIPEHLGTNQELESFHKDDGISVLLPNFSTYSGNFSSSGESEAISQGSPQADSSKRKLEDHQHSSNFLPMSRGFEIFFDSQPESKKSRITENESVSANIDFRQENKLGYEPDTEAIAQVKQMIYRAAALRPVNLILEEVGAVEKPKRKNVRISSDPQTVAARHRRERISDRLRILQKLVPGGSKMDTASMLDEAANYLKFLKTQVTALETLGTTTSSNPLLAFNSFTMHHQNPSTDTI